MEIKAILFDLDGTLLPMDMHEFTNGYFQDLCKKLSPFGIEPDHIIKSVWSGVGAMVKNDGTRKNIEAFWECFYSMNPEVNHSVEDYCSEFYGKEFMEAKRFTQDNPLAVKAVSLAHNKAQTVVLASNPLFPMVGHATRLSWVNLKLDDFDMITSYESDSYCKPNPEYYKSICKRLNLEPSECLMIGNDENEDMYAASLVGINCYLVTDTMIPSKEHPWKGAKGTFKDMLDMLEAL